MADFRFPAHVVTAMTMTTMIAHVEVPMALTGDALFTMGCGRVFTGNFAQMQVRAMFMPRLSAFVRYLMYPGVVVSHNQKSVTHG